MVRLWPCRCIQVSTLIKKPTRTVGVTPIRAMRQDFAEVKRVCQDCTIAGLEAMREAGPSKPFRFVYLSGDGTPRDMTKQPLVLGQFLCMRVSRHLIASSLPIRTLNYSKNILTCSQGEGENMVLEYGAKHPDVEICIAKPGVLTSSVTGPRAAIAALYGFTNLFTDALKNISTKDCAAAILDQVVHGFGEQTLLNADLVRIGRAAKATP